MARWSFDGSHPDLEGYEAMQRKINALVNALPDEISSALYAEAQIERTESMKRTPVDVGNLRASHMVSPPTKDVTGTWSTTISVGGPAAPYAVHVHENLDAHHKNGQAKFLESTLKESAPHMSQRVARRIDLRRASEGK